MSNSTLMANSTVGHGLCSPSCYWEWIGIPWQRVSCLSQVVRTSGCSCTGPCSAWCYEWRWQCLSRAPPEKATQGTSRTQQTRRDIVLFYLCFLIIMWFPLYCPVCSVECICFQALGAEQIPLGAIKVFIHSWWIRGWKQQMDFSTVIKKCYDLAFLRRRHCFVVAAFRWVVCGTVLTLRTTPSRASCGLLLRRFIVWCRTSQRLGLVFNLCPVDNIKPFEY